MKVVVDTNIVFSGILSPSGRICDLLLNSQNTFDFYAPTALLEEIDTHSLKLVKLSGFSAEDLNFLRLTILRRINFINVESIKHTTWQEAIALTEGVDRYDAPFIALSLEMGAPLWTGDKKLADGLRQKGINWILSTRAINEIRGEP